MNQVETLAPAESGGGEGPLTREQRRNAVEAIYATGHWLLGEGRPKDAARVLHAMALLAHADERCWLALGACHQAMGQPLIALEMYGIGRVLAKPSVRCEVARVRVLRVLGRDDDARMALEQATTTAETVDDPVLRELVRAESEEP
jgi:hypothetical protein